MAKLCCLIVWCAKEWNLVFVELYCNNESMERNEYNRVCLSASIYATKVGCRWWWRAGRGEGGCGWRWLLVRGDFREYWLMVFAIHCMVYSVGFTQLNTFGCMWIIVEIIIEMNRILIEFPGHYVSVWGVTLIYCKVGVDLFQSWSLCFNLQADI